MKDTTRSRLEQRSLELQETGMDERAADRQTLQEFGQQLHADLNLFKKTIGLPEDPAPTFAAPDLTELNTQFDAQIDEALGKNEDAKPFTERKLPEETANRISDALFAFADKVLKADITGSDGAALSNLFAVPQQIIGRAIQAVAVAVKAGETIASAIQKGLQILRDAGHDVNEEEFGGVVNSLIAGQKPRIRVPVKPVEPEAPPKEKKKQPEKPPTQEEQSDESGEYNFGEFEGDAIRDYRLTTSGDVDSFMTDETMEAVFGDPRTDDKYAVQKLADMLEDGRNMIGAAQTMFGGMDVKVYGPKLFDYLQRRMSNDVNLGNKKAVLIATFLGEIKQAMERDQQAADDLRQLYNATFNYYRNFMNQTGKSLVAGRLLRLYRDKYMSDIFQDRILEEEEMKRLRSLQRQEAETEISNQDVKDFEAKKQDGDTAAVEAEIKESKKERKARKATESKRKEGVKEKYTKAAAEKAEEIKKKSGSIEQLKQSIIDRIKNINCK